MVPAHTSVAEAYQVLGLGQVRALATVSKPRQLTQVALEQDASLDDVKSTYKRASTSTYCARRS